MFQLIIIKNILSTTFAFIKPYSPHFFLKILKKKVLSLYCFAVQQQTGTLGYRKMEPVYLKLKKKKLNEYITRLQI